MRSITLLRIAAMLTLGSLSVISASAQDSSTQQNPDPMAEAARKARAEQQSSPKPKKVFTNDDFAPSPAAAKPTDSTAKPADSNAKEDDKDTAAENDPKSEAYWRKRFAKAHAKLAQAEQELDVLQRELDKNEVQYYPDPQTALMQQYTRKDINDNKAKLDAKKKEVDTLKQQISDMEDELRKAGGDSGWAR
jgi:chromosome segregation ATPase